MKNHTSLYKTTNVNGTESFTLALNMIDAVNKSVSVLPCGFVDTAEKIEYIRDFEITDLAVGNIIKEDS